MLRWHETELTLDKSILAQAVPEWWGSNDAFVFDEISAWQHI